MATSQSVTVSIPSILICPVCSKLLCNTQHVICCGKHVCKSCLESLLEKQSSATSQTCPFDCGGEKGAFGYVPHFGIDDLVKNVTVKCHNCDRGCRWVGRHAEVEEHIRSENGCLCADVECPNRCISHYDGGGREVIMTVRRKHLKHHLDKECLLRPHECDYCGLRDTYSKIVNEHQMKDCPEYLVLCENACAAKIKRKDLEAHYRRCPEHIVECPFFKLGCREDMLRRCDLNDHLSTDQEKHDSYVQSCLNRIRKAEENNDVLIKRLEMKENEIKDKMAELECLKAELEQVKAKNEEKLNTIATDVKIMKDSQSVVVGRYALASVQSQLTSELVLTSKDNPLVVRMMRYSEYLRRGLVWHSPPFSVRCQSRACNMFVSVFPRGVGSGMGSHISLKLCWVRGENHAVTGPWPIWDGFVSVYLMVGDGDPWRIRTIFQNKSNNPSKFFNCQQNNTVLCTAEKFATVDTVWKSVVNDSIALIIEHNESFELLEMSGLARNLAPL